METGRSDSGGLLTKRMLTADQVQRKQQLIDAGNAAFDDDNLTLALDCYHRASVLDSADAAVWNLVGLSYANLDFPREAWRSFKLALVCEPDDTNTLWYAAEFLFNIEDFPLARLLLERYLTLEEDPERREEARDLLKEAIRQMGDDDSAETPALLATNEIGDADDDDDLLEGFEIDDQNLSNLDDDDEEDDFEDDIYDDDSEAEFIASLGLELTGMREKCSNCSTGLPTDAPYCYSCLAPHFYEVE